MLPNYKRIFTLVVLLLATKTSFASYSSDIKNWAIGDSMYRELQGAGLVDNDLVVTEYISFLATKLNYSSVGSIPNLTVFVVKDPEINAFAFFGNNIGVHQGLILSLPSENELAAVLAHEMAHIHLRHLDRFTEKQQRLLPASILAIVGAIALGLPDLATAAMANHYQQVLSFSRDNEHEADRVGMNILASSKFDPYAMANAFKILQDENKLNAKAEEFLSTHPLFNSRIADAENRANTFPYIQHPNSLMYEVAKARIEIIGALNKKEYLDKLLTLKKLNRFNNSSIFNYKLALAYGSLKKYDHAISIMRQLSLESPNTWTYQLGYAELILEKGDIKTAIPILEKLNNEFPRHPAILYQYAKALVMIKKYSAAKVIMLELIDILKIQPFLYEDLARVNKNLGENYEMHKNLATAYTLCNRIEQAITQLDLANKYTSSDIERKKIAQRKDALIKIKH